MFNRILFIFCAWRISLFLAAFLGTFIMPFNPRFPYSESLLIPSGLPSWIWNFANFDGVHYLTIAKTGYSAQFTQVFFPLYPLIIRPFAFLLSDKYHILSGLLIANIAFFGSLIVFTRLLQLDYQKKTVFWILLFLVLFPTSFFFGSLYSESLFLLFTLSSLYAARKRRWWIAGILGGLASATRLFGIFLLPALLWEWQKENFKFQISNFKFNETLRFTIYLLRSPILYLVPLGLIFYMVYLQNQFGDWLYFWHAQPVFGAERSGNAIILLPQVFFRYAKILTSVPYTLESFFIPLLELLSTIFALTLLLVAVKRKVRKSYIYFSLLSTFIPTLTGTLSSMPRYILVAFPIYIFLGNIKTTSIKVALAILSFILLACLTIFFSQGNWVA